jgi:uncharacterized membrane protein
MVPRQDNASGPLVALVCLIVFAVVFVIYTTAYLPDRVATHFSGDNQADGWMSRDGYLLFVLAFLVGAPLLLSLGIGTLTRRFPQWTNVPHRDYWLAPLRRDASLQFLTAHGKRLGCLVVMLMVGMHYTLLLAHHSQPPRLPVSTFSSILFGFVLALVWWIVRLYRRFAKKT